MSIISEENEGRLKNESQEHILAEHSGKSLPLELSKSMASEEEVAQIQQKDLEELQKLRKELGVESREEKKFKEPWEMMYDEFLSEYETTMKAMQEKEKNPGESLTEEEKQLIERDWKAFSRKRGYSEADIAEYERWYILSGQRDHPGAINDPWRRMRGGREQELYVRHIQHALDSGKTVSPQILEDFEKIKESIQKPRATGNREIPNIPSAVAEEEIKKEEDVW